LERSSQQTALSIQRLQQFGGVSTGILPSQVAKSKEARVRSQHYHRLKFNWIEQRVTLMQGKPEQKGNQPGSEYGSWRMANAGLVLVDALKLVPPCRARNVFVGYPVLPDVGSIIPRSALVCRRWSIPAFLLRFSNPKRAEL
jgi:hypothetical protein